MEADRAATQLLVIESLFTAHFAQSIFDVSLSIIEQPRLLWIIKDNILVLVHPALLAVLISDDCNLPNTHAQAEGLRHDPDPDHEAQQYA